MAGRTPAALLERDKDMPTCRTVSSQIHPIFAGFPDRSAAIRNATPDRAGRRDGTGGASCDAGRRRHGRWPGAPGASRVSAPARGDDRGRAGVREGDGGTGSRFGADERAVHSRGTRRLPCTGPGPSRRCCPGSLSSACPTTMSGRPRSARWPWNTMATSRSLVSRRVTSRPPIGISPSTGSSRPAIMRTVAVLPRPEGSGSTGNSQSAMSRSRSSPPTKPPRRLDPLRS